MAGYFEHSIEGWGSTYGEEFLKELKCCQAFTKDFIPLAVNEVEHNAEGSCRVVYKGIEKHAWKD